MQGGNAFINFSNIQPDANALGIRISVVLSILYMVWWYSIISVVVQKGETFYNCFFSI